MRMGLWISLPLLGLAVLASYGPIRQVAASRTVDDAGQGQALAQSRCAACHGTDGNRTVAGAPRLAGLSADYLVRQTRHFADGTRPSATMAAIASSLSDDQLHAIAEHYASQSRERDLPGPPEQMALGRALFRFGAGPVPACAACHGPGARARGGRMGMRGMMGRGRMMGGAGAAPDLFGQRADYVVAQLEAFADGRRPATVMGNIARDMSATQRQAVADFVAAHP
jgi:cytochrome c553